MYITRNNMDMKTHVNVIWNMKKNDKTLFRTCKAARSSQLYQNAPQYAYLSQHSTRYIQYIHLRLR